MENKYQEAIIDLRTKMLTLHTKYHCEFNKNITEKWNLLIELAAKENPIKPAETAVEYMCPSCLETLAYKHKKKQIKQLRCHNCGQCLDWNNYKIVS